MSSESEFSRDSEDPSSYSDKPQRAQATRNTRQTKVAQHQLAEDGYGPDLIGDERDRAYVNSLSKIEREKLLLEREERREQELERRKLLRNTNERDRENSRQAEALELMKTERERKRTEGQPEVMANYENVEIDSDYEDARLGKRVRFSKPSDQTRKKQDKQNRQQDLEPEDFEPDRPIKDLDDKDLGLFKRVMLNRGFLISQASQQHFKETVVGCYVKASITIDGQTTSKLARIEDVNEAVTPYEVEGKKVTKSLRLRIGAEQIEEDFKLAYISNKPVETLEIRNYFKELEAAKLKIPTIRQINQKAKIISKNLQAKTTHEQIVKAVEGAKEEKLRNHTNLADKKRVLEERLEKANYKYFEKATAELKRTITDLKNQIAAVVQQMETDPKSSRYYEEQPIVIVQKSDPYAFTNQVKITDSSKIHKRTIPQLENMWSVNPDKFRNQLDKPVQPVLTVTKSQQLEEQQTEKGLYMLAQELKTDFLRIFDRPLGIDTLIDSLEA